MRNDFKIRPRPGFKKGGKAFPELTGDGKKMKNSDMKKSKK